MLSKTLRKRLLPIGLTASIAVAIAAGTGFSGGVVAKPAPDKTAAAAQAALAKGQVEKAIELAEAVVAAAPREPAYRALLAHAYLKAGRFDSAAATFDDAMKLGDNGAKTALGLSLAYSAGGRNREAIAILQDWRDAIPSADLGLALALAGEPTRGAAILSDALRAGENTPKLRQNLAYAYALEGRWREARIMMSQDVPADQIDARISDWAARSKPEDARMRVAGLLGAPLRSDPGQPVALALNASPAAEQMAVEAAAIRNVPQVAVATPAQPAPVTELPAREAPAELAAYKPVTAPVAAVAAPAPTETVPAPAERFATAFAEAPRAAAGGPVFVSNPVIQAVPASEPRAHAQAPRPARARMAAAPSLAAPRLAASRQAAPRAAVVPTNRPGTHLVQLASFFTEQGARRAWGVYAARNPELRGYRMTITKAQVRGKTYYRVAAAGIEGSSPAWSLCGTVKARGMGCFAYAASTGVPGTKAVSPNRMALKVPVKVPTPVARMARSR